MSGPTKRSRGGLRAASPDLNRCFCFTRLFIYLFIENIFLNEWTEPICNSRSRTVLLFFDLTIDLSSSSSSGLILRLFPYGDEHMHRGHQLSIYFRHCLFTLCMRFGNIRVRRTYAGRIQCSGTGKQSVFCRQRRFSDKPSKVVRPGASV